MKDSACDNFNRACSRGVKVEEFVGSSNCEGDNRISPVAGLLSSRCATPGDGCDDFKVLRWKIAKEEIGPKQYASSAVTTSIKSLSHSDAKTVVEFDF